MYAHFYYLKVLKKYNRTEYLKIFVFFFPFRIFLVFIITVLFFQILIASLSII